jgi:hypothetical protein
MKGNQLIQRYFFVSMISASLVGAIAPAALAQAAPGQTTFASASAAAAALVAACKSGDQDALLKILGPAGKDLISSGDPVADKKSQEGFAKNYAVKHRLTSEAQGYETLIVGANDWPMPIPIVRDGERWYFDSARGHDEVIDRRIHLLRLHVSARTSSARSRSARDTCKRSRCMRRRAMTVCLPVCMRRGS